MGQAYRLQDFYMAHNFNPAVENEPDSPEDEAVPVVVPAPPSLDEAGDMWRTYIPPIPPAYQYPTDEGGEGDVTHLGSPGQESPARASASQEATPSTGPTVKRLRRASRRHRGEPPARYSP